MRRSTLKTSKGQFRKIRSFAKPEKIFEKVDSDLIRVKEIDLIAIKKSGIH
jgi:hypothetical protein